MKVKINGFEWFYNESTKHLSETEDFKSSMHIDRLTVNERRQLEVYTKYNGVPMVSF